MKIELHKLTENAENLIEKACRVCYQSYHRYNPPESTKELIPKVIRKGHYSILEHASATFKLTDVSRVLTHELVRHRLASFSQESQRYVCYADKPNRKKTKDFIYNIPNSVKKWQLEGPESYRDMLSDNPQWSVTGFHEYEKLVLQCYDMYERMLSDGVPPEDARYILPNATCCDIFITANLREWRHIFEVRGNPRAHWEIRIAICRCFEILKEKCSNVFYDMELINPNNVIDEDSYIILNKGK